MTIRPQQYSSASYTDADADHRCSSCTERYKEGFAAAQDGAKFYWRRYSPKNILHTKGTIVIVHGFGEHLGMWCHVATYLLNSGFCVILYDQRGCGRSEGTRGHQHSMQEAVSDLHHIIAQVATVRPLFLYGHCSGATICIQYELHRTKQQQNQQQQPRANQLILPASDLTPLKRPRTIPNLTPVDALILSAPYLELIHKIPALQEKVIRLIAKFDPVHYINAEIEASKRTRDPAMQLRFFEDHNACLSITARKLCGISSAGRDAIQEARKIHIPILVLHGTCDEVTDPSASAEFVQRCASADKEFKLLLGHYHDLHLDLSRSNILDSVRQWIEARYQRFPRGSIHIHKKQEQSVHEQQQQQQRSHNNSNIGRKMRRRVVFPSWNRSNNEDTTQVSAMSG